MPRLNVNAHVISIKRGTIDLNLKNENAVNTPSESIIGGSTVAFDPVPAAAKIISIMMSFAWIGLSIIRQIQSSIAPENIIPKKKVGLR